MANYTELSIEQLKEEWRRLIVVSASTDMAKAKCLTAMKAAGVDIKEFTRQPDAVITAYLRLAEGTVDPDAFSRFYTCGPALLGKICRLPLVVQRELVADPFITMPVKGVDGLYTPQRFRIDLLDRAEQKIAFHPSSCDLRTYDAMVHAMNKEIKPGIQSSESSLNYDPESDTYILGKERISRAKFDELHRYVQADIKKRKKKAGRTSPRTPTPALDPSPPVDARR